MPRTFGKGVLLGLAVFTAVFAGEVSAGYSCVCVEMPGQTWQSRTTEKLNAATAVFSGKVIAIEWRKDISPPQRMAVAEGGDPADWETRVVRFKVDRWWRLAAETEM